MKSSHRSSVLALLLTVCGLPLAHTLPAEDGAVVFQDVTEELGVDYRRTRSPSEAIFDELRMLPAYTFNELVLSPIKGRGAPGVALLDFDGDGDLDLYVTNGPGTPNGLYANQLRETGVFALQDVAESAGVDATEQDSNGVCFGDFDNDGDPDLVVLGNAGANLLFENLGPDENGAVVFADVSIPSGVGERIDTSTSCSTGDVDGDGLLDLVIGYSFDMSSQIAIFLEPFALSRPNQLLRNLGGLTFEDVSESSGILDLDLPPGAPEGTGTITWATALADIDGDGDLDFIQADDQAAFPNEAQGGIDRGFLHVLINDGTGHFTDETSIRGLNRDGSWMGLAIADFDHNGKLDLFGTNFGNHTALIFAPYDPENRISDSRWFLQGDDGVFIDSAELSGPQQSPFGWGASAVDYDNDGDSDIIFHGGLDVGPAVATNPGVVWNNDGSGAFRRDHAALAESADHLRRTVQGMAAGDLNEDGFIDVVSVSNFDFPDEFLVPSAPLGNDEFDVDAFFLPTFNLVDPTGPVWTWAGLELPDGTLSIELSGGNDNGWVQIDPIGAVGVADGAAANRDGIGAVVRVRPGGMFGNAPAMQPVLGGSSHASQDSRILTFGLGDASWAVVEIDWPGGTRNRYYARSGARLVMPEIPCAFDDPSLSLEEYVSCMATSLEELVEAKVIRPGRKLRLLVQSLRARAEAL